MWRVWGRREVIAEYWWGNVKERGHLEDVWVDGRILKYILKKQDRVSWTEFIRLMLGTNGVLM